MFGGIQTVARGALVVPYAMTFSADAHTSRGSSAYLALTTVGPRVVADVVVAFTVSSTVAFRRFLSTNQTTDTLTAFALTFALTNVTYVRHFAGRLIIEVVCKARSSTLARLSIEAFIASADSALVSAAGVALATVRDLSTRKLTWTFADQFQVNR